jgi:hypothetical protein
MQALCTAGGFKLTIYALAIATIFDPASVSAQQDRYGALANARFSENRPTATEP